MADDIFHCRRWHHALVVLMHLLLCVASSASDSPAFGRHENVLVPLSNAHAAASLECGQRSRVCAAGAVWSPPHCACRARPTVVTTARPSTTPYPVHNSNKPKKILFFVHLHKSGGSYICSLARQSGVRVPGNNCNAQRDQRCCGRDGTLKQHQEYARRTRFELVGAEKYMHAVMDTENFSYFTVLRRSIDRYISHYGHIASLRPAWARKA